MPVMIGHPDFDLVDQRYALIGRAKDAVKQNLLVSLYEDFHDDPTGYSNSTRWNPSGANTNSFSFAEPATIPGGGAILMSTGATANSICGLAPANSMGASPWTVATATAGKGFYMEGRMKITTTPDAQAKAYIGFTDATNTLLLGCIGSLSTTQAIIQHSANEATTSSNLGRVFGTTYHRYAMWSNGRDGNVYAQMDGDIGDLVPVTITPTVTYAKLRLFCRVRNGGTAANQAMELSYLFVAVEP